MKYLLIILTLLTLYSCCTKQDCEGQIENPSILLYYKKSNIKDNIDLFQINIVNDKGVLIDSTIPSMDYSNSQILTGDSLVKIPVNIKMKKYDLRNYTIVLFHKKLNITDSITNIKYDSINYKLECNSCFLTNDIRELTRYTNYSYYYNKKNISTREFIIN